MNVQLDIREEDLPRSLDDIVRAIGVPATVKLIKRFGGSRMYVPEPEHVTKGHTIARLIGLAAARSVAMVCAQCRVEIPRATQAFALARGRAIRLEPSTLSVSKLARKYKLTERQIYLIRSRAARASDGNDERCEAVTRRARSR